MQERNLKVKGILEEEVLNVKEGETYTLVTFNKGEENSSYKLSATVEKDATLNIYNIATSDKDYHLTEDIDLIQEGATVNVINVYLFTNKANLISDVNINHLAKATISEFDNWAIAKDEAYLCLNNNATIKKGMAKSEARQRAKGLTLSKDSKIKAMPNLFIDEYDVIAYHGASIGSINKDDLFYLMSRGLTLDEASELIVLGFIQPVLDKISNEDLKKEVNDCFVNKLSM